MPASIDRVVVINDDCVQSGGAAAIAITSIEELRARGIPVTLITGDAGANPDLTSLEVDVVALGGRHILEGGNPAFLRGLYSRAIAARLSEWIAENDTPGTIYHLHNWHKFLSPSAFVPLRRVAQRLVICAHDYFLACPNGGYFHFPRGEICHRHPMGGACLLTSCDKRNYAHKLWRVARTAVRHLAMNLHGTSATVIAVHEGMVPLLAHAIDRRAIRVLRNPASPWLPSRVAAERNHRLLFVGRIEQDKGVVHLARAARMAAAPLRMIGTGPLVSVIRCDFPEVELTGWRPKAEVAELCRDARALVMPSQMRETFGLVAIEAAMSGIPIIVSQAALISSDLERLRAGIVCDGHDVSNMANAIDRIMRDDALVAEMSRCGFTTARSLAPTSQVWGDQLVALYEEKLSNASPLATRATAQIGTDFAPAVAYRSAPKPRGVSSAPEMR
jgi:glycosyltransferase involved in cell wall biosynthesis